MFKILAVTFFQRIENGVENLTFDPVENLVAFSPHFQNFSKLSIFNGVSHIDFEVLKLPNLLFAPNFTNFSRKHHLSEYLRYLIFMHAISAIKVGAILAIFLI